MGQVTIDQAVLAEPLDISDLTSGTLEGTGALDILLKTVRVQLDAQFAKNRMQGTEYATVYKDLFDSVLNTAATFLLAKERQALEIKGLELQNELAQAQIDQIHDQMQKTPYEIEAIQASIEQTKAQTLQVEASTENVQKDTQLKAYTLTNLYPAQLRQTDAQTANIVKDTDLKQYQIQYLYPAQLENARKQNDLLAAQILNQTKQLELMAEQISQAKAQTEYYAQKVITEKAQTNSTVIGNGSVIGTQVSLMKAQEDGYQRNAEQQAAQIIANTWNVRRQTDEDTSANTTNLLDDASVGKVMQKLFSGINVNLTPS